MRLFLTTFTVVWWVWTPLRAQTVVFWDLNGSTPGASSSTAASGTWNQNSSTTWSTSPDGTSATGRWQAMSGGAAIATFGAGANATGTYSVTISGTILGLRGLVFEEGTVTLSSSTGVLQLGATAVFDTRSNNATIAAGISEAPGTGSGITKIGSGRLTFTGAGKTYTGETHIGTSAGESAGILALGASNLLPNTAVRVFAGTLSLGSYSDTVGAVYLGGGGAGTTAAITGTGTLYMGGDLTYSAASGAGSATISARLGLGTATRTFHVQDGAEGADLTISGLISGSGGLVKTGAGTLTLANGKSYTGSTNIGAAGDIDGGILQLGSSNVLPSTTVNIYGGTLDVDSYTDTIGALNMGGGAPGTRARIIGSGTLTLGGNVTYVATSAPLGAVISSRLGLGANRIFTIQDSAPAAADLTISGMISNGSSSARGLTKGGAGTLLLSANNIYSGGTTILAGVLESGSIANGGIASGIGASSNAAGNLILNGGTLRYTGSGGSTNRSFTLGANGGMLEASGTAGALAFTSSGSLAQSGSGNRALVLGGSNASDNTLAAAIGNPSGGSTAVVKSGSGTWVLSGNSSYTGSTSVDLGTLKLGAAGSAGNGPLGKSAGGVFVNSGGTLDLNGVTLVNSEALTLSGTGSDGAGALTNSKSSAVSYGGRVTLAGDAAISGIGNIVLAGGLSDAGTARELTKTGANTVTIGAAASVWTVGSSVVANEGTLRLGASHALGDSAMTQVTVASGGAAPAVFEIGNSMVQSIQSLSFGGQGSTSTSDNRVMLGTGSTLTVNGNIGYAATGDPQGATISGAGRLDFGTEGRTIAVADSSSTTQELSITSDIAGSGALVKTGGGTLILAGASKTFAGNLNVAEGAVLISGNDILSSKTNAISIAAGANLAIAGGGQAVHTIRGLTGAGLVNIAADTRLVVAVASDHVFDGRLAGAGSLTKEGTGVWAFSSASNNSAFDFAGTLELTGGLLSFAGGTSENALRLGTLTLSGGTLLLDATYINVGVLNITGDTILDFGTGDASILNAANIYIAAGRTLTVRNWTGEVDFLFAGSEFRLGEAQGGLAARNTIGQAPQNQILFETVAGAPDGSHTAWIGANYAGFASDQVRPIPEAHACGALIACSGALVFGLRRMCRG